MPSPSPRRRVSTIRLAVVVLVTTLTATLAAAAQASTSPSAAGRVGGFVFDQLHRRLADATVLLSGPSGDQVGKATTDDRGRWSTVVPQGDYDLTVTARSGDESLTANIDGYRVGADSKLNIVVAGGSVEPVRLSGRIVDGAGDPVAGATILLGETLTTTDPNGRFVIEAPPSRYRLQVNLPVPAGLSGHMAITVRDLLLLADRDIAMTIPTAEIVVVVRDEAGRPLA